MKGESMEFCLNEGNFGKVYDFDDGTQYFNMEGKWKNSMSSWECGANVFVAFCKNRYEYEGSPIPLTDACEE